MTSDMDADDWDTGTEYTLYIGSGPTRAQVEAVLDPHFHPDGDSFASAQWDVDETDPDEVALASAQDLVEGGPCPGYPQGPGAPGTRPRSPQYPAPGALED